MKLIAVSYTHICKSSSTQQATFCKGICNGKEWVIELTGTPVVNKHKDLIPQLSIPVSYTHLDVYKRQLMNWMPKLRSI